MIHVEFFHVSVLGLDHDAVVISILSGFMLILLYETVFKLVFIYFFFFKKINLFLMMIEDSFTENDL